MNRNSSIHLRVMNFMLCIYDPLILLLMLNHPLDVQNLPFFPEILGLGEYVYIWLLLPFGCYIF